MPQSRVGSMQGFNEDCLPMKGHTQGGDTPGVQKIGIRGIQDTRQMVTGKTDEV